MLLSIKHFYRVAKHQINRRLREKMRELKVPIQEPYKGTIPIHRLQDEECDILSCRYRLFEHAVWKF
jgi:hypothetical protein